MRSRAFALTLGGAVALVLLTGLPLVVHPAYDRTYYTLVVVHLVAGLVLLPLYYYALYGHLRIHLGRKRIALLAVLIFPITFAGGIGPPFVSPWHNPLSLPCAILAFALWRYLRRERRLLGRRVPPLRPLEPADPAESLFSVRTGAAALVASWLMVHTGFALVIADFKFANDKYFLHGPVAVALMPLLVLHVLARAWKWGWRTTRAVKAALAGLAVVNVGLLGAAIYKNVAPLEGLPGEKIERVATEPAYLAAATPAPDASLAILADSRPCQACHFEASTAWSISSHRFSGMNALYVKLIRQMADEVGPAAVRYCDNCHDPLVALTADPARRFAPETLAQSEGVSCKVCHFLDPATLEHGNGSYAMKLVESFGFPGTHGLTGITASFASRLDARLHIRAVNRPAMRRADACRPCHVTQIPAVLNGASDVELTPLFASWRDWKDSDEIGCRECHMVNVDRDRQSYRQWDHRFAGSNQALSLLVPEEHREEARKLDVFTDAALRGARPRGDDRNDLPSHIVDLFWGGSLFPVEIESLPGAAPGHLSVRVRTTNSKMGHDFPGDLLDQVEAWLELRIVDASGTEVFRSGGLRPDSHLEADTRRLGAELFDRHGARIAHHETWRVAEIRDRRALPPGGHRDEVFDVPVPPGAVGPLTVTATWRFRRATQEIADMLFDGDGTTFPVTELARAERRLDYGGRPGGV